MNKIYKKTETETWVIPIGDPPAHHFKEVENPPLPHSDEKVDIEGLKKYQQLKEKWKI